MKQLIIMLLLTSTAHADDLLDQIDRRDATEAQEREYQRERNDRDYYEHESLRLQRDMLNQQQMRDTQYQFDRAEDRRERCLDRGGIFCN